MRRTRNVAACLLTGVLAACGGGAPNDQPKPSTGTEEATPQSAAPVAAPAAEPGTYGDWSGDALVRSASPNAYGASKAPILNRNADGSLVFKPETQKDHVAYPFVPVPPSERSVELALESDAVDNPACKAHLQDQGFHVLETVDCNEKGQRKKDVTLAPDVTSVRVFFDSPTLAAVHLPTRLTIRKAP